MFFKLFVSQIKGFGLSRALVLELRFIYWSWHGQNFTQTLRSMFMWHTLRWLSSFVVQEKLLIFNFQPRRQRKNLGNVNFIRINFLISFSCSPTSTSRQLCQKEPQSILVVVPFGIVFYSWSSSLFEWKSTFSFERRITFFFFFWFVPSWRLFNSAQS